MQTAVARTVLMCLMLSLPVGAPAAFAQTSIDTPLLAHSTRIFMLDGAQQSVSSTVLVDDVSWLMVHVRSPLRDIVVEVTDPLGQQYSSANPDGDTVVRYVDLGDDPDVAGSHQIFAIYAGPGHPVPAGMWTYSIQCPSALASPFPVYVEVTSDSIVRVGVVDVREKVRVGDPVSFALLVFEGSGPHTGAAVSATIERLDAPIASPPSIQFRDDGVGGDGTANDGLYTTSFALDTPGYYQVLASITGTTAQNRPFERAVQVPVRVLPDRARILPGVGFALVNCNSFGLCGGLGVSPQLNVIQAGVYDIRITLVGAGGVSTSEVVTVSLDVGIRNPQVVFLARKLRSELAVSGPWTVSEVRVEYGSEADSDLADIARNIGDSPAYSLGQFERAAILSIGAPSSRGVDENGNGKFERLEATLALELSTAGSYAWEARLVANDGTQVGLAQGAGGLLTSAQVVMSFDGPTIAASGISGPYRVMDFTLDGVGGSGAIANPLMTAAFDVASFEGYCTLGCPDDLVLQTGVNSSGCGVMVTYSAPSMTANCGPVSCAPTSGSLFPVGTTTVTCTTATAFACSFTVTVVDTTVPLVSCPAGTSTNLTSGCLVSIPNLLPGSAATDNCTAAGSVAFSQLPVAGTMVGPGVHTITVYATDEANNTGTCMTTFTVVDAQPPTITGPVPALLPRTSNSAGGATVTFPTPLASDNCGTANVTATPASGTNFPNGKTLVTATAVDAAGLTASTQFTVKVVRFGESIGIYIPSTAGWFLKNTNSEGGADLVFSFGPVGDGWVPIAGDWDRSGTDTPGLFYNPTAGVFLSDTSGPGGANYVFTYGPSGLNWIPLAGDWNGEGVDSIGLYDPTTGNFFLKNINAAGNADVILQLGPGNAGFLPIVGDWNGDGIDTVGIYNPDTGAFFLRNSNTNGPADLTFTFGAEGKGYLPISGDWNGDNVCTIGLYNPTTGAFLLRNSNDNGPADMEFLYGPGDEGAIPVAGSWDGQ